MLPARRANKPVSGDVSPVPIPRRLYPGWAKKVPPHGENCCSSRVDEK
jgi:hypothetical protein